MRLKPILALLAVATLTIPAFAADEEDTPLSKEMSAMNKSFRAVKKQLADPAKKEENVALLEKIKKNIEAAQKLEPKKTPEKDKEPYLAKFKDQLKELSKTFDELETAIKADKQDEAKKIVSKIGDLKEKGHKDFAPEDDK